MPLSSENEIIVNFMRKVKPIALILGVLVMSVAVGYLATAWTDAPTGTAPFCPAGYSGCDTPINIGSASQTKSGSFNVMGDVGVGTEAPGAKLEVVGNIIASAPTADSHVTTKAYVDAQAGGEMYSRCYLLSSGSNANCDSGFDTIVSTSGTGCGVTAGYARTFFSLGGTLTSSYSTSAGTYTCTNCSTQCTLYETLTVSGVAASACCQVVTKGPPDKYGNCYCSAYNVNQASTVALCCQ
jgi:hypothetical protein